MSCVFGAVLLYSHSSCVVVIVIIICTQLQFQFLLSFLVAVGSRLLPTLAPFNLPLWEAQLVDYWVQTEKDVEFRGEFICDGLASGGFDVGIPDGSWPSPDEDYANGFSFEAKYAITQWVVGGLSKGHVIGPFSSNSIPFHNYVISPLFTVPKPSDDYVKKYRIIHNLSARDKFGVSVNDVVDGSWKAVQYTAFLEVVKLAHDLGPGAFLWTVDAEDAYYRVPIKRKYWPFMGFRWLGFSFFFTSLAMGLASACNIYTKFADAVEYVIVKNNYNLFHITVDHVDVRSLRHYLDDFFGGHCDESSAIDQFTTVQGWFVRLGIPTRLSKCVIFVSYDSIQSY